jgi:hypothetical protein
MLTRRQMFGVGPLAALLGADATKEIVPAEPKPVACIIRPGPDALPVSDADADRVRKHITQLHRGTPLEGIPVFILPPGADMEYVTLKEKGDWICPQCGDLHIGPYFHAHRDECPCGWKTGKEPGK